MSRTPATEEVWTILRLMRWSGAYLEEKGVERGRLDAEHLLAHALGTERLELYLQFDRPLTAAELAAFRPLLRRRAAREPLQYIVGRAAFRQLDLAVDRRVLIPRPETEELVEAVLKWAADRTDAAALDLGTGSGAIALSLAHEGPFRRVVATDASVDALEVARSNAEGVVGGERVEFRLGSFFEPIEAGERFDVVVSNPPYVAERDAATLQAEVRDFEPPSALYSGADGLDALRVVTQGAGAVLAEGGLLALEVGEGQTGPVGDLLAGTGEFDGVEFHRDLAGRQRIVLAHRARGS